MDYRLHLYTQTSKYTGTNCRTCKKFGLVIFFYVLRLIILISKYLIILQTSVINISQNRFRAESNVMSIVGVPETRNYWLLVSLNFYVQDFTNTRPLYDLEKGPCSPLERALL